MGKAKINPNTFTNSFGIAQIDLDENGRTSQLQQIEFDVAVTVADTRGTEGGGGIKVFSAFELGGKASETTANTSTSRIKFSVPVVFP